MNEIGDLMRAMALTGYNSEAELVIQDETGKQYKLVEVFQLSDETMKATMHFRLKALQ